MNITKLSVVLMMLVGSLSALASNPQCEKAAIQAAVAVDNSGSTPQAIAKALSTTGLGNLTGKPVDTKDETRLNLDVTTYGIEVYKSRSADISNFYTVELNPENCFVYNVTAD